MNNKILIVDDEPNNIQVLNDYLCKIGFTVLITEDGETAIRQVSNFKPDLILLDVMMPRIDGFETCRRLKKHELMKNTPIIFLTAKTDIAEKVKGLEMNAVDYIIKPFQIKEVVARIKKHLLISNLRKQQETENIELQGYVYHLKSLVNPKNSITESSDIVQTTNNDIQTELVKRVSYEYYHDFIGISKPMQAVYQIISNIANSKVSILITGESGTGKELCAEAVCKESRRVNKLFIVCNCAAIPEKLMESHLFGHVKGAFTGADNNQEGLVSRANGGTLFLDEIGELSLIMQSSLLRFVQTKTFSKVGSCKLEKVDIRLICATNKNLLEEVKAKQFRGDLYHRINTIEIKLPVLRQRGQDILLLAVFFMHRFAKEEQNDFQSISTEAQDKLLSYQWSGNVRQLKNTIHNIVILNTGKVITAEMISKRMDEEECHINSVAEETGDYKTSSEILAVKRFCDFKEIEKEVIIKAIDHCGGNVVEAAKLLKISKTTLYRKRQKWK